MVGEAAGADSVEKTEGAETVDIALVAYRVMIRYVDQCSLNLRADLRCTRPCRTRP